MNIKTVVFAALLTTSVDAQAADPWSRQDVALEAAYQVVAAVDWAQTHTLVNDPNYYETNGMLGADPSSRAINRHFVLGGLAHAAVTHLLPSKWRTHWHAMSITFEAAYVARNVSIGVRVGF